MNQMLGAYQLREAAGAYWLIDMRQDGRRYKKPFCMNETGARIVRGLSERRTQEELAGELAADYGMPVELLREDVRLFCKQLQENGIFLQEL